MQDIARLKVKLVLESTFLSKVGESNIEQPGHLLPQWW